MDMTTTVAPERPTVRRIASSHWPLIVGILALVVPSFISLARQVWSTEAGVHGPIVLATGVWLIVRRAGEIKAVRRPGSNAVTAAIIGLSLLFYVFGRAFDFIFLEIGALGGVLVGLFYLLCGGEAVRRMWFPIFYLGFLIPLPGWFVDQITAPLKSYISWSATELLQRVGYPVAREGVTLYIAQYQLLVEDACAGLNSIISLTAISLFYIYILHNANWRYSLFLVLWIIPVAMLANLVRVLALVLITYYWGNAAAQGYLHSTAGLVMFATALIGIFAVDGLMTPVRKRLSKEKT